jgi:hypothetical protein
MKEVTSKNFGLIIAFWLPGFILLWNLSYLSDLAASAIMPKAGADRSVGDFLFASLGSLALGLLVSAARSLILEPILYWTGVKRVPEASYAKLANKDVLAAFEAAIEAHYRYSQYYGNTLIAVATGLAISFADGITMPAGTLRTVAIVLMVGLALASRKELRAFCEKARHILT